MISSKKLGRMVSSDVDRALANIDADTAKPDMKSGNEDLAKAVAPKKAESFAEAFRAARARGDKTFSWAGKPGMKFTTEMAGQGAKRPAATSASTRQVKTEDKPNNTGASETSKASNPYTTKANSAPFRAKPTAAAERRAKVGNFLTKLSSLYTPGGKDKPWLLTGKAAREANRKMGTIGGKAKGGKIDGCAVRGKTRAMRSK